MDELKIQIVGSLNIEKSTTEINKAVANIEKKLESLKLNIQVDEKISKTLNDFSLAMENQKKISQDLNKVLKEEQTVIKNLDGSVDKLTKKYYENNKVTEKVTKTIDNRKKSTLLETQAIAKQITELEKLGEIQKRVSKSDSTGNKNGGSETYKSGSVDTTYNFDKGGNVTSTKTTENIAKEKLATEQLSVAKIKLQQSVRKLNDEGAITTSSLGRLNKAIDNSQNINQVNKLNDVLNRADSIAKTNNSVDTYKKQAQLNVQNLQRTHGKNVDDAGIKDYLSSVDNLRARQPDLSKQMGSLNMQFKQISANAKDVSHQANVAGKSLGAMLSEAAVKFPLWMGISTAFYAATASVTALVDTLYLLDERLISIDKVLDNADMTAVFDNASEAAMKYGRTIDGALESLGEISKLGFDQADAEQLNSNSMLLSTVGEFKDDAEAANYLVAIMKQYKLEVGETAQVVDSLNNVSNKTGADTQGLAQALSKASSTAAMAGVSFHEFQGMASSTIETLKISGNEAGTFYKALFSRYMRGDTQSDIEALGIQTKDATGELRSATEVFAELGDKWKDLSSTQKAAISESLGGVWHINKVSSLMENQASVLNNTEASLNSYGSAQKELETFQEGLNFKTQNMIATFQKLAMVIGENGARDAIVAFLETVTYMTRGFSELTEQTNGWNIKLPLLAAGIYGAVKALGALRIAITGVKASMGWIGLGVVAIEMLASTFMSSAGAAEINTESLAKNAQATNDQATELERLIAKYEELQPQAKGSTEKQAELEGVLKSIQQIAPHLIESTGNYGDALDLNKQKADNYVASLKEMTKEQLAQASTANSIEVSAVNVDIDATKSKLEEMDSSVKKTFDNINSYKVKYDVSGITDAEEEFRKRIGSIGKEIGIQTEKGNTSMVSSLNKDLANATNEYENYVAAMKDSGGKLAKYSEEFGKLQELEGKKDGLEQRQKAMDEMAGSTKKGSAANDENADSLSNVDSAAQNSLTAVSSTEDAMEGAAGAATEAVSAYDEYSQALQNSVNIENQKASASEMIAGITSSQIDTIYEQIAVYQLLNEQENLNEQQKLMLADATSFLSGIYPSLVAGSEANIDAILRETQANDILLEAVGRAAKGQLSSQETQTLNSALGAKARIDILKAEILAVDKMVQAHKAAAIETYNAAVEVQNELGTLNAEKSYKRADAMGESRITGLTNEIDKLMPDFQKYTSALSEQTGYQGRAVEATEKASKANEKSAKSAEKAAKEYKTYTYVTDKFAEAIEKVNIALAKQQAIQSKYPKYSKQYRNAIKEEIKQLEKKEKLLTSQAKSLDKQIKSGKIKETGVVEVGGSSTTTGRTSSGAKKYSTKVTGSSSVTASDLNAILKGELKGMGAVFIREATKAGLDPAFLASVAMHESGNGSSNAVKNKNNAFGIMGSNGLRSFSSLEKNISYTADMFKRLYTSQGLDSIVEIQKKYAPDGAKNDPNGLNSHWQKGVLKFWNQFTNTITTTATKSAEKVTSNASKNVADYYLNGFRKTGKYNESRSTGNHKGLDLANGKAGSPVKSLKGGKVITATYSKTAGYWVVVEQDDGKVAKYMHMQKGSLKVKAGQRVEAGQQLGNVGNTGRSSGNHLHLQVEEDGKTVNPENYLKNINSPSEAQSEASKQAAEQSSNVADAQSEVLSLQEEQLQVEQQIQELRMELVQSNLSAFDHERKLLEDDLAKVDLQMQKSGEGTDEWIKLQLKKETLLAKEIKHQQDSIAYLKAELKYNKDLTAAQKATLGEELIDRTTELYSLESQLLSERENMAEQAIDAFKQALEAQKEAAIKAIDKMIEAINKEAEEEDYAKNLSDAQKERQKTLDEISEWQMNDSPEALKKLQELNEQLQEQDESIADMQTDRERELRVENLEGQKEKVETNYDNLINDEKKFAKMRSDIINGNAKQILKDLDGYAKNIRANANILGKAMSSNLIDLINQANKYLKGKDYKPIKVAQAREGGILPSWGNSGRLMYVHEEEMISNKSDTKNLLAALKMSETMFKQPHTLKNIKPPTFIGNGAVSSTGGTTINMPVYIDTITGDEAGTRTMLTKVVETFSTFVK